MNICYTFDEEFVIKVLKIILEPTKIKKVKYYRSMMIKVNNVIDRVYNYSYISEVDDFVKNLYQISGGEAQKGIYNIELKSGMKFYVSVSEYTLKLGKSIELKNSVKFILAIVIFISINYIFRILHI